ncbi:MAG TPA: DUF3472 domain-containing protein [Methylomirabilota bacterium]|nr:DUF3472 domain-containing protein [Methylomirabilota bacterium]
MKRLVVAGFVAAVAWGAGAAETNTGPRAARSVHLAWTAPEGDVFYNEMTVEESVPGSYFMAVGWNTGYFGIQELGSSTNKVVIFSVWDPTQGDSPDAVPAEQRVELLHADSDVRIKRFGGEGTGGQSMWSYPWRIGETCRFVLQATVQSNKTAYAAHFYVTPEQRWKHLATFRTITGGTPLRGYYSFVEDFRRDSKSVAQLRRARFDRGWVRDVHGQWLPLRKGRFTASNAAWEAQDNIDAGLSGTGFFLATGGAIRSSHPLRSILEQAATPGARPADLPVTLGP